MPEMEARFLKKRARLLFEGIFLMLTFFFTYISMPAQKREKPGKGGIPPSEKYTVSQTHAKIKIDGMLDEEAWQEATKITLAYECMPGDNIPAPVNTECLLTFSQTRLYIGFRCFDPAPQKIRGHLMDRDALVTFLQDDYVSIFIDTFNDERRAFDFRVNPLGVQVEGILSEWDGSQDFSWDAIWESAGAITDSGYVVEIAIPFNQLRFPDTPGEQTWGFSFARSYPRTVRHRLISHPLDRNSGLFTALFNKVTGFDNMQTGRNLEFDPTLTSHRTDRLEDFPGGEMAAGPVKIEPGITARWGITSNLILNVTLNPDFSHVEADVAQLEINTRFALRYPEKRPFFLEGIDFFRTPLESVFTRAVFDPLWGIKMTGKLGKNALGFFLNQDQYNNLLFPANQGSSIYSQKEKVIGGVFRFRRDVGKGSTLGVLYTGRVAEDYHNHVAGVDGFLRLSKTRNIGFQFLRSSTDYTQHIAENFSQPFHSFGGNALFFNFRYTGRYLAYGVDYENLSANFRADCGFIPRVDFRRYFFFIQPIIWGKPGGWFDRLLFGFAGDYITNQQGELTDQNIQIGAIYQGLLQTFVNPLFLRQKERYQGVIYDLNEFQLNFEMKPVGGLKYFLFTRFGDSIDYTNSRLARSSLINPGIEWSVGKHLNMDLSHIFERLSFQGEKIYTVNLFQARLVYNFNVKTFLRAILQYMDISRNTDLYVIPIEPESRNFFTQFLFSYKINPQTVLFLGYSDNLLGTNGIDLIRTDRTFFLKIGYALLL